jgi:hypothetical protein
MFGERCKSIGLQICKQNYKKCKIEAKNKGGGGFFKIC